MFVVSFHFTTQFGNTQHSSYELPEASNSQEAQALAFKLKNAYVKDFNENNPDDRIDILSKIQIKKK